MRREVVHHHAEQVSVRIVDIGQVAHVEGEVARRPELARRTPFFPQQRMERTVRLNGSSDPSRTLGRALSNDQSWPKAEWPLWTV